MRTNYSGREDDINKHDFLDRLNEINLDQTEKLSTTSRNIMYAIFATNFSFILAKQNYMLFCCVFTCILVVIYFACELTHYYIGAKAARGLFDEVKYKNKNIKCAECEMNRRSRFTFLLLKVKLIIIILSIICEIYYFISFLLHNY